MIDKVIKAFGPIDIIVNNAGTSWGAATTEHTLDAWNKVMTLNVSAIFVASQEVGRRYLMAGVQRVQVSSEATYGVQSVCPPELTAGGRQPSPGERQFGCDEIRPRRRTVRRELGDQLARTSQLETQAAAQCEVLFNAFGEGAHGVAPDQGRASSRNRVRSTLP